MAIYNSFIFEGHGTSEKFGTYDPGAVNGSSRENDLVDKIVSSAIGYLKLTKLIVHRDENNYSDNDLSGNVYSSKAGICIHINAGGGTGTEIYVPCKEKCLSEDFNLVKNISSALGIPNRGVKSRDYTTGNTVIRSNGTTLAYTDYYKEIRDAWSLGYSLAILEVGFIDTGDLDKIKANIDKIGFLVAKYIAALCGVKLEDVNETTTSNNLSSTISKSYYRVVCGSFTSRNNAETRKRELENKGYNGIFIDIYKR